VPWILSLRLFLPEKNKIGNMSQRLFLIRRIEEAKGTDLVAFVILVTTPLANIGSLTPVLLDLLHSPIDRSDLLPEVVVEKFDQVQLEWELDLAHDLCLFSDILTPVEPDHVDSKVALRDSHIVKMHYEKVRKRPETKLTLAFVKCAKSVCRRLTDPATESSSRSVDPEPVKTTKFQISFSSHKHRKKLTYILDTGEKVIGVFGDVTFQFQEGFGRLCFRLVWCLGCLETTHKESGCQMNERS
jgi:hypothetical protein